jgi:2-dehydro-3-deoxygalactonokinase
MNTMENPSKQTRKSNILGLEQTQETELIGLDWGTSSLRAYRFGRSGFTLAQRCFALGVKNLASLSDQTPQQRKQLFQTAFEEACGDWVSRSPNVPIIACGMIGSAQGWSEVPYLEVPLPMSRLGAALITIHDKQGHDIRIVPGLIQKDGITNVMRGEETQLSGCLNIAFKKIPAMQIPSGIDILIGMPGSHSKWAYVRDDRILHFETFMTGELYDALCSHTILAHTMVRSESTDYLAFDRGIQAVKTDIGDAGLLSSVFSVRTLGLTRELSPTEQPEYLSGLLIGHEIAALLSLNSSRTKVLQKQPELILLAGDSSLCARYIRGLASYGHTNVRFAANASERGLWSVAVQGGLIEAEC